MSEPAEAFEQHQWERRHALVYRLQLSALYHQKQSRWYDWCHKITQAISVLGSAAAIAHLLAKHVDAQLCASAIVAVVSTLALVFGWTQKSRLHHEMARDYRRLLADVERAGEVPDERQIDRWTADCTTLESQEPATLAMLVLECQYELSLAYGTAATHVRPSIIRRLLMHVLDFSVTAHASKLRPGGAEVHD